MTQVMISTYLKIPNPTEPSGMAEGRKFSQVHKPTNPKDFHWVCNSSTVIMDKDLT